MNKLLICPAKSERVAALAETCPLALQLVLGKPLIEHWIEHMVISGVRDLSIIAPDRPRQLCDFVGDGARWGLRASVHSDFDGLPDAEKWNGHRSDDSLVREPAANDVIAIDHLPRQPGLQLFTSYSTWFAGVTNWLPHAAASPNRLGVREIQPGIWVGLHTRVAADAELHAPCWLGEHVFVGSGASLGPMAVVENRAFIGPRAKIVESIIGPETFVGESAEIRCSLAWGDTLVNWKWNSFLKVPDTFLLRSLKPPCSILGRLFPVPPNIEPQINLSWKFNVKTEL